MTPLQQLHARERAELAALPRRSPQRARIKERYARQAQRLKEAQRLVLRARAAIPKKQRGKKRATKHLTPESILREARRIKEQGAKLSQPRTPSQLRPPKEGRVTRKCFDIPRDEKKIQPYIQKIVDRYRSGGGPKGLLYGWRAQVELKNGQFMSTKLNLPEPGFTSLDYLMTELKDSDPTFSVKDNIDFIKKICIIISWNVGYD